MDSSIVAQIINEIVEACINDAMPETIATITCGQHVQVMEKCDIDPNIMQVNKDIDDEMEIIDQMEALESDCESVDDDDDDDIIRSTNADCDEATVSGTETRNGTKLNISNDFKPQSEPEIVSKVTAVETLASKGFSMWSNERKRRVCNLRLLQNSSKFTMHDVRCEGFPSKMTEIELVSLFQKCGQVFVLKRILTSNVLLVTYTRMEDADRAVESFHRRIIQGHKVRVARYIADCRLVVLGISSLATKKELFRRFSAVTDTIQSVQVFNDPKNEGRIRRFCYLCYSTWEEAEKAKKRLSQILPSMLSVEWPRQHFEWTKTPDTLCINNLWLNVRRDELEQLFSVYGQIVSLQQSGDYARIRFERVEDATRAAREIDRRRLGNENVEIRSVKLSRKRPPAIPDRSSRPPFFKKCDRNTRQSPSVRSTISANGRTEKIPDRISHPPSSDTLYLKSLRSTISATDLRKCFSVYGEVMSVDKENDSASVRFRKSENAKRAAQDIDKRRLGENVQISLVELLKTSDTLHIYNLFADMTTKRLRALFSAHGEIMDVDLRAGLAIVRFRNKTDSERAAQRIDRMELGKAHVEILFFAKKMC